MGRSRHGIIGPDDPSISYKDNLFAFVERIVKEYLDSSEPWRRQNRYAYVCNNPTNRIDPLGLDDVVVVPKGSLDAYEQATVNYWKQEAESRSKDETPLKVIEAANNADANSQIGQERDIDSLTYDAHGSIGSQRVGPKNTSESWKDTHINKDTAETALKGFDLKDDATVQFDGCNIAQDQKGNEFLKKVAEVTQRKAAAWSGTSKKGVNSHGKYVKKHEGTKVVVEPQKEKDEIEKDDQTKPRVENDQELPD